MPITLCPKAELPCARPSRRLPAGRGPRPALVRRFSDWAARQSLPFASRRFLIHSLFKVLFNFPSRYLFAIGLATVFSLRWSLPPALGCIPKQPDSEKTLGKRTPAAAKGLTPALGRGLDH